MTETESLLVCGPWASISSDYRVPEAAERTDDSAGDSSVASGNCGCFEAAVVAEPVEDTEGFEALFDTPGPSTANLLELDFEELRTIVRETDILLEEMRSQRNVARRELENLRRRFQQQICEYDRRLNQSHLECERLRRQVDALTVAQENTEPESRVEPAEGSTFDNGPAEEPNALQIGVLDSEEDLRRVFSRIRNRSRQEKQAKTQRVFDEAISNSTFTVCVT